MRTVLRYDDKPHLLTRCFFATGRSCILHLLRKYDPDVVFVPELHPAGVVDPIDKLSIPRDSYRIKDDFEIDLEDLHRKMLNGRDGYRRPLVIAIHYFGYWVKTWGAAALAHEFGGILLEDCAHCLPTDDASVCGDVRLYSYNKIFPVIDGAVMFSCTPRVDLTFGRDKMEPLQDAAVEAYSRHLSANRIIADMPVPSSEFEWERFRELGAVSERAYEDYYAVISKDMEPRKSVSLEYLGQYNHEKEKKVRVKHAHRLMRRISRNNLFRRDDFPVMALPVRAMHGSDEQDTLLVAGVHATHLGPLWSGLWQDAMLLPLHPALSDKQLDVVGELFG